MTKILLALLLLPAAALAKVNVVTTTTDLEALVTSVGGDQVTTFAIAKGTQDPHQIEAKPSFMVKMRDADLVIAQGLELESAWIVPLIQGARNPKVAVGSNRFLELADKLEPIEIPAGTVTRAQGDVHPGGNPHFQVDPIRLGKAAVLIANKLGEIDGTHRDLYKTNAEALQKRLTDKSKEWAKRLAKTGVHEAVTFHKGLSYFLDRYGIGNPIQLEPRPGIPPTAAHLIDVVELMKKRDIHLVLIENYYDDKAGEKVKADVPKATVKLVPISVGGEPGLNTNEQLIERIVKIIEDGAPLSELITFIAAPFVMAVLLVGIHAYLGLHVLQRDVIFVDISLSQVAALGGAISLFLSPDEDGSMAVFFSLGLCLVVALALALFRHFEKKISQEAIIGITYALASGTLILVLDRLPHGGEHLKTALVGNILFVTWQQVGLTALIYAAVGVVHAVFGKKFWAISRGAEHSLLWDFLFYFLFGVVITFSTHHAGVLVVFSILVVPAALAFRFKQTTGARLAFAWSFGLLGILLAFGLSLHFDWPAGAAIVTTLTSGFFLLLVGRMVYERLT